MVTLRRLFFFFVGVVISILLMVPFAYSSDSVGPFTGAPVSNRINYTSSPGTTYTKMVEQATGPIQSTTDHYRIPNKAFTTLPNGLQIEAELITDVSKASLKSRIASALARGRANPYVTACFVLCPALVDQGWKWMQDAQKWVAQDTSLPSGYYYNSLLQPFPKFSTPDEACVSIFNYMSGTSPYTSGSYLVGLGTINVYGGYSCRIHVPDGRTMVVGGMKYSDCSSGYSFDGNTCTNDQYKDISDSLLNSTVNNLFDNLPSDQAIKIADIDGDFTPDGATQSVTSLTPQVETPEKTISKTTTKNPDGTETTKEVKQKEVVKTETTTNNSTVNNTTINYTTTVVTNTYTNNSTTPDTSTEEEKPDTGSVNDRDMPELPELYEPKYPDGPQGVWNANKPNIETTAFYQGVSSMFPSFGGGQCPAFAIPAISLGAFGNFGSFIFDVPCWIFQAIGLILMTTAAFTARKIIF